MQAIDAPHHCSHFIRGNMTVSVIVLCAGKITPGGIVIVYVCWLVVCWMLRLMLLLLRLLVLILV